MIPLLEQLFKEIEHGDEEHRKWLYDKMEEFSKQQTMIKLFWYKRKVTRQKEVEKDGKKEIVNEVINVWDCINVDTIVRGFWKSEEVFSLMLNDGHEQSEDRQRPIYKNGKAVGTETKRERDWFYSQIDLDIEDTEKLMAFSGWTTSGSTCFRTSA